MLVVHDVAVNISIFVVGTTCPVLVLITAGDGLMETVLSSVQIDINQKVYFLSSANNQAFETYIVNNIRIVRKLEIFEAVSHTSKLIFNPELDVETDSNAAEEEIASRSEAISDGAERVLKFSILYTHPHTHTPTHTPLHKTLLITYMRRS
jgi:hypothetical protein